MVIYSSGLRPYLFLISLMLGSGFPPVLPWPTGHRAWVGPLRNCLEPTPQTHSFIPHFSASFPLLFPFSNLLPLHVHNFTIAVQHPHAQAHSVTLTYSLSRSLLLCLTLALSCSHALACHLTPASSTQSHANILACTHTHLGRLSHTLTWITFIVVPPSPTQHLQCSLSASDVTLANTFHFLGCYIQNAQICEFYLCKFKLKLSSGLGGEKNPSCCVIAGTGQFVVV